MFRSTVYIFYRGACRIPPREMPSIGKSFSCSKILFLGIVGSFQITPVVFSKSYGQKLAQTSEAAWSAA